MKDNLEDIAFRILVDPINAVQHAAKVASVIKVLNNLNKSYTQFLEIEFLKNEKFKATYDSNSKVLDTLKEDLDLLIVDLNFSSFEAALAPNLLEKQPSIFKNEVLEWKKNTFNSYKNLIILGQYRDPSYLQNVVERYTSKERRKIFQPLFASAGDGNDYILSIVNNNRETIQVITRPDNSYAELLTPKIQIGKDESEYGIAQVYIRIKKDQEQPKLNNKSVKEILHYEELEHDTYPFKPNIIKFGKKLFILKEKLECQVNYEDTTYVIKSDYLDILVWGDTREEAEDAFNFTFFSLYNNYGQEEDKNLSDDAQQLKRNLISVIDSVIDEA